MTRAILKIDSWAGRRQYAIEIVGETRTRYRVRVLEQPGIMLPGRRWKAYGETALVPRHAVVMLAVS